MDKILDFEKEPCSLVFMKFKIIFILFSLILAPFSFAGKKAPPKNSLFHLLCVTEYPTTSFVVESDNEYVSLRVYHHNGTLYAPMFSGIVTPYDVKNFSQQAAVIESLGTQLEARWKLSQCQRSSTKLFSCFGSGEKRNQQGAPFVPFSLYSTSINEEGIAGPWEYLQMVFNFEVNGQSLSIPMKYHINECELE